MRTVIPAPMRSAKVARSGFGRAISIPGRGPVRRAPHAPPRVLYRKKDTVLEKESVTGAKIVGGAGDVRRIIRSTLASSSSKLFPYVKKSASRGKIKYEIDQPAVFASKYRKYAKRRRISIDPSTTDEDLVREIGGFYDPRSNTAHLKTRSDYCDAFHETVHGLSNPDFLMTWFGRDVVEGLTQYFTDVILKEQRGAACGGHKYGTQLACAKKLVKKAKFDTVARVFFTSDVSKLDVIAKKLGVKDMMALRKLGSDGICKRAKK